MESRFIPTHVGNASASARLSSSMPVHPHARGERSTIGATLSVGAGSSPRTWGTLMTRLFKILLTRFIPTHVGNAPRQPYAAIALTVHPHARGERELKQATNNRSTGSSPRTWGTPLAAGEKHRSRRFIPTHVGNASGSYSNRARKSVHPHARGERFLHDLFSHGQSGSSPRTWGTQCAQSGSSPFFRFIPTHVGNASRSRWQIDAHAVHPHARGERYQSVDQWAELSGSSPRTWGTLSFEWLVTRDNRFIPTHVGNALPDIC